VTRPCARLAAALAAVLLAGCTSEAGDPPTAASDGRSSAAPSVSAGGTGEQADSARVASPPAAPERDACYRLGFDQLTRPSNDSDPVRCGGRHVARTIHVGRLDTVVDGHALAVDSDRARAQLARTCPRRLAAHLGGTPQTRDLSRFAVVWFSPTLEESDRGAQWFRCDLVAIAGPERLHPLPRRTAGILDRPGALARFGLCGTAEPGTPRFERVICARPHSWRAIATIPLPGGRSYPGAARVRPAGNAACRDVAAGQAADPLQFEFGWEWPTRDQWANGQRYGYCWAPD
jgi:hypothetical protein